MKNNLTIGIIGAMDCEISKLKSALINEKDEKKGNLNIFTGELYGHKIILVKSGVGKVNSAICTQYIIDKYNPDFIINTGIAGGVALNLNVGDIVIGRELVQYDFDVSAIGYAKGYMCTGINKDKPTLFYSNENLIQEFIKAVNSAGLNLKVHQGVIATGDTFVSDKNKKIEIRDTFNASAVEMEGCAIAQTSAANNVPFLIIRAISDLADDKAAKEHAFVEEEMAELSSNLIENLIMHIDSFEKVL